jgi:hypothetical protein
MRAKVHSESVAEKLVRADERIAAARRFAVSVARVGIAGGQRLHEADALVDDAEGELRGKCVNGPVLVPAEFPELGRGVENASSTDG